jgi:hypothetical protein
MEKYQCVDKKGLLMRKSIILLTCFSLQQCFGFWGFFDAKKSVKELNESISKVTDSFDESVKEATGALNASTEKVTDSMNNFTLAINNAVETGKPIAWTGVGVAGVYVAYRICGGIAYSLSYEATVKRLRFKQERAILIAKKNLLNLIKKNIRGEIGAYSLPKACDQAVRALVLLPGGLEELEKVTLMFKKYMATKIVMKG